MGERKRGRVGFHPLPGGGCRIDFETVDDARAPPREDLLRLGRLAGSLELAPGGEGRVRVEHRVHLEPGGALIPWMVEPSRRTEGVRYLEHLMAPPSCAMR